MSKQRTNSECLKWNMSGVPEQRDKTRAGEAGNHREVIEDSFLQELLRKMPECMPLLNRARIYTLTFHVGGSEVSADSFLHETSMTLAQSSGHTRCPGQKPEEHRPGRGPPGCHSGFWAIKFKSALEQRAQSHPPGASQQPMLLPSPASPSPPGFIFTFCKDVFV